jgi:ribose 5-phosphate isomerase B
MGFSIAIACDHGGFELKAGLCRFLEDAGHTLIDLGTDSLESVDYPDKAHALAEEIIRSRADFGILICGTGIGISIAANRHKGIRAALCTDSYMAKMAREHNDANVLCLGGRIIGPSLAEDIAQAFLSGKFQGGRHARRLSKIEIQ